MARVNRTGAVPAPTLSDGGRAPGASAAPAIPADRGAEEPRAAPRPWSVYLLRCADGTLYAGATNDIARRLKAHGRGAVRYTRGRLPVELWWIEEVGERGPALSREAAIKRLSRPRKLRLRASAP